VRTSGPGGRLAGRSCASSTAADSRADPKADILLVREELADRARDLLGMRFQGEMTGVDETRYLAI